MADFQYADMASKDIGNLPEVDGPYGLERSPMNLLPPLFSKQDEPQDYSFRQPASTSELSIRVYGMLDKINAEELNSVPIKHCWGVHLQVHSSSALHSLPRSRRLKCQRRSKLTSPIARRSSSRSRSSQHSSSRMSRLPCNDGAKAPETMYESRGSDAVAKYIFRH